MRASNPSRFSPAAANTMASQSPASSLARRLPTLPRRPATRKRGNLARSWLRRRKLPVPSTASGGKSAREANRLEMKASRGSARSHTAAKTNPRGNAAGMSLTECTAKSASPRSNACSNSFKNTPLPPTSASGRSLRSPVVVISRNAISRPGARPRSKSRTYRACHNASGLARVAMTRRSRPDMRAGDGAPRIYPPDSPGSPALPDFIFKRNALMPARLNCRSMSTIA